MTAKEILALYDEALTERAEYDQLWDDIRRLIHPNAKDFAANTTVGKDRNLSIYDGTAPDALKDFASAMFSHMTPMTDRWFSLEVDGELELNRNPQVIAWLQAVAEIIYAEYQSPKSGFATAMQEAYTDLGAFGMPVVYQEYDYDASHISMRAMALASVCVKENSKGVIDTLYREILYTPRQLQQEFKNFAFPREVLEGARKWSVIHATYPRSDRLHGRRDRLNKKFASCWVLREKGLLIDESGYDTFPYHVARWSKVPDGTYGIGPGQNALPDTRMVNKLTFLLLKGTTKRISPSLLMPEDGFTQTDPDVSPDAIIPYAAGTTPPSYLEYKGDIPIGLDVLERLEQAIRRSFYGEWAKLQVKKERQSAYEIAEIVEQQLRMMAPMVARAHAELLGPMIERTYSLLSAAGRIPDAPPMLDGARLKLGYTSPAARAQLGTKAVSSGKFVQELAVTAQIKPDVVDKVDFDALTEENAIARGIDRRILRTQAQVDAIREARAQNEQAAQIAGAAEPVSKAILNISQAQQAGNIQ